MSGGQTATVCARPGILTAVLTLADSDDPVQVIVAQIALTPGTGTVIDGPGNGLAGVSVALQQRAGDAWIAGVGLALRPASGTQTTLAGGRYGWQLVPDATYRVVATRGTDTRISPAFNGSAQLPTLDFAPAGGEPTTPQAPLTDPVVLPQPAPGPPAHGSGDGGPVTPPPPATTPKRPSKLNITFTKSRRTVSIRVECASAKVCRSSQKVTVVLLGRTIRVKVSAWKTRSKALKIKVNLGAKQRRLMKSGHDFDVLVRAKALGRSGAEDRLWFKAP